MLKLIATGYIIHKYTIYHQNFPDKRSFLLFYQYKKSESMHLFNCFQYELTIK